MFEFAPVISIIIPVYNVEKYIKRCLDSIFNQEFSGTFEVIAVDDGSTDNSLKELRNFQINEPRLCIIEHKVNRKLSIARATGMAASTGDYIMHVDSDDWLLPGALEFLYNKCLETDADVIVFDYIRENEKGIRTYEQNIKTDLLTSNKSLVQQFFYGAPWNKIIKRGLVKEHVSGLIGINMTEDLLYSTEIFLKSHKICLTPVKCYVYFENTGSLTWKMSGLYYLQNQIIVFRQLERILEKYSCEIGYRLNIINYLRRYWALYIARIHLFDKANLISSKEIGVELSSSILMDKQQSIFLTNLLSNKYYCFFYLLKYFGLRTFVGLMARNLFYRK